MTNNGTECGLNGDWNCRAWHFGPSSTPNQTDGDVYVLDNEDDTFSIVRRVYVDGDNDVIMYLADDVAFDEACEMARQLTE